MEIVALAVPENKASRRVKPVRPYTISVYG